MTHTEYADALRSIADWIVAHPEIEVPHTREIALGFWDEDAREKIAEVAKAIGSCEKTYTDKTFKLYKDFGGITYNFYAYRAQVCERVVVGTHPEEIIEWRLPESLLALEVEEKNE